MRSKQLLIKQFLNKKYEFFKNDKYSFLAVIKIFNCPRKYVIFYYKNISYSIFSSCWIFFFCIWRNERKSLLKEHFRHRKRYLTISASQCLNQLIDSVFGKRRFDRFFSTEHRHFMSRRLSCLPLNYADQRNGNTSNKIISNVVPSEFHARNRVVGFSHKYSGLDFFRSRIQVFYTGNCHCV